MTHDSIVFQLDMTIRLVYSIMWNVYTCAQVNNLLLIFMLSRVEVFTSFPPPPPPSPPGGVLTTTSGARRGVGYSVASFPGPSSSGALPSPQGNSLSVPSTVMICGCVMCVDCYVTVYAVRW